MKPSTQSKQHMPIIKKARGKYVTDINNKKYIDYCMGNLTNVIGYQKFKFSHVPNYSGKSFLEDKVSFALKELTGRKYYKYFKNGMNSVEAAVRTARNIIGNKNATVTYFGYMGMQDNYIWTTKDNNGIPKQNSKQVSDGKSYREYDCDILVFEDRHSKHADKINARIRIIDFHKSGVYALYNKSELADKYDFACYGKSIGSGYPISFLTGRDEMMERTDDVYISTTFGGENTGLEAILKTMEKYDNLKYSKIYEYATSALPPWRTITKEKIDEFLLQGIIYNGFWGITQMHTIKDIDFLAVTCNNVLYGNMEKHSKL